MNTSGFASVIKEFDLVDVTKDTIADALKKFDDEGNAAMKITTKDNDGNVNGIIVISGGKEAQAINEFVSSLSR